MKKNNIILTVLLLIAAFSVYMLIQNKSDSTADDRINIATTIFPLYDITKNIAGENGNIINVLPAGASPHTFEITPERVRKLQNTEILFKIGHEIDDWTSDLAESIDGIEVVTVDDNITLLPFSEFHVHDEDEELENEDEHEELDPHYWLSVSNAKHIAKTIADKLTQFDPDNSEDYIKNLNTYTKELDQLIEESKAKLSAVSSNKIIVTHDAWQYFNTEFGLETAGAFQPSPGQEATLQQLAKLQELVTNNDLRAIFTEPQLSQDVIEPFANDANLPVYTLDPMGGIDNRLSYIDLIKYNVDTVYRALK